VFAPPPPLAVGLPEAVPPEPPDPPALPPPELTPPAPPPVPLLSDEQAGDTSSAPHDDKGMQTAPAIRHNL